MPAMSSRAAKPIPIGSGGGLPADGVVMAAFRPSRGLRVGMATPRVAVSGRGADGADGLGEPLAGGVGRRLLADVDGAGELSAAEGVGVGEGGALLWSTGMMGAAGEPGVEPAAGAPPLPVSGLCVCAGEVEGAAPWTVTVIVGAGSRRMLGAAAPVTAW